MLFVRVCAGARLLVCMCECLFVRECVCVSVCLHMVCLKRLHDETSCCYIEHIVVCPWSAIMIFSHVPYSNICRLYPHTDTTGKDIQ